MGMFKTPSIPSPVAPSQPAQEVSAATQGALTDEERQLALFRGVQSTWANNIQKTMPQAPASGAVGASLQLPANGTAAGLPVSLG